MACSRIGLLGPLIDGPEPVRLEDIAAHASSLGLLRDRSIGPLLMVAPGGVDIDV